MYVCKKLKLTICDISIIDLYSILKNCLYIKIYYNDTVICFIISNRFKFCIECDKSHITFNSRLTVNN